jgi:hypothetical protein
LIQNPKGVHPDFVVKLSYRKACQVAAAQQWHNFHERKVAFKIIANTADWCETRLNNWYINN